MKATCYNTRAPHYLKRTHHTHICPNWHRSWPFHFSPTRQCNGCALWSTQGKRVLLLAHYLTRHLM